MASSKQKHKVSMIANKEKESEKKRDKTVEIKPLFLYPDSPSFECPALKKLRAFRKILQYIGTYKEPLVARQDLENRRQLFKADKLVEQPPGYPTQQFFKQGTSLKDTRRQLPLRLR